MCKAKQKSELSYTKGQARLTSWELKVMVENATWSLDQSAFCFQWSTNWFTVSVSCCSCYPDSSRVSTEDLGVGVFNLPLSADLRHLEMVRIIIATSGCFQSMVWDDNRIVTFPTCSVWLGGVWWFSHCILGFCSSQKLWESLSVYLHLVHLSLKWEIKSSETEESGSLVHLVL